jgi:hypothetical protein
LLEVTPRPLAGHGAGPAGSKAVMLLEVTPRPLAGHACEKRLAKNSSLTGCSVRGCGRARVERSSGLTEIRR